MFIDLFAYLKEGMEALVVSHNVLESEWAESHFPLYTAISIHSLHGTSNLPLYMIQESFTVLIAIAGGKGTLNVDQNQSFELSEGNVILLPADYHAELVSNSLEPLHAYKLSIGSREEAMSLPAGAIMRRSEVISRANILFLPNETTIVANMEELYLHRLPAHEARHIQNQILFHGIIFQLLEQQDTKHEANEQPSVERSMIYMESHYRDKITREQLAAMAGVSPSHYSILFKQLTGFTPNEYLSRLRVHKAMELLINSSGTLREIAQKVGYKDEFYLSRRFKQQTGVSPSAYNRTSQRVSVLLMPYASHLLLLGVEPVVAIAESSEYIATADLQQPQTMRFINTDSPAQQIKATLIETKTDLIIAARQHLHHFGLRTEELRAVAPVVEVPWDEMGWKEHLRLIARAVDRSQQAEQWMAVFEQEEQQAREIVKQLPVASEIVTILVLRPEELRVYGGRNAGYVLYRSLGLQPPALIDAEMKKLGDQFHSISITLAELAAYAGDRLLVIVFPDVQGSSAHAEAIFQSAVWKSLPAVQQNRVHQLYEEEWIPYNPVSIRLQLQRAVTLFSD